MSKSKTPTTTFAKALAAARQAAALTGTALAKRSGFSGAYLSDMENGQRPPPPKATRTRIYKAMRLSKEERAQLERLCAQERCPHCDSVVRK